MNRSYTKIRKIQEANINLEQRRVLDEQNNMGYEGKGDPQIGDPQTPEPQDPVTYLQKKLNWKVDDTMKNNYGIVWIHDGQSVDTSNTVIKVNRGPMGKNFFIEVEKKGKPVKRFNGLFSYKLYDEILGYVKS